MSRIRLILGSGSPRRKELMEQMELRFVVDSQTSFQETVPPGMRAEDVPAYFAEGKSLGFHRSLEPGEVLVTADTVVICDGTLMGKPRSSQEAVRMLEMLSGRTHKVVSAVCVRRGGGVHTDDERSALMTRSDTACVSFRKLGDKEIQHYVEKYSPLDKAGAYGIQEWIGLVGISCIEGSFYTIMGLPTHLLWEMLGEDIAPGY